MPVADECLHRAFFRTEHADGSLEAPAPVGTPAPDQIIMKTPLLVFFLSLSIFDSVCAVDHDEVHREVQAGRLMPLAKVLAGVRARHAGEIIDVELDWGQNGRQVYEVRLLDRKGRRRVMNFDAVTGQEVESRLDRPLTHVPDLLRKVSRSFPGRVIDIDLENLVADSAYYAILILRDDGLIQRVRADAYTGELLPDDAPFSDGRAIKPISEVIDILLPQYPGSVVEVGLERDRKGQLIYEVELKANDGRLTEFIVDPVTARVLNEDEIGRP